MYNNVRPQLGVPQFHPQLPTSSQPNLFGNTFNAAGSGLIQGGLGAYGGKIFGSSSEYVQSNISRYFSDPQYYFQVNDHYVKNKLKVILFPFLHRGHWTRITEPVGGRLSYKPPIYDINAPDLYIPLMAFGTYVVLAGISLGLQGKFSPETLNWLFIKGLVGWFMQTALLKVTLFSLSNGEAPLMDIIAYAGYAFPGLCLAVLGRMIGGYSYYILMPWTCLCMGIFLVKTMKRVLFAEMAASTRGCIIPQPINRRSDFFLVMLLDVVDAIKIPSQFTSTWGHTLSNPITIRIPEGREWHVNLNTNDGKLWLEGGWAQIIETYNIKGGNVVFFKYAGTSKFDISIYDVTTVEISYATRQPGAVPIQFYRPISDLHQLQTLRLPSDFSLLFGWNLQNPVYLMTGDGREWRVSWRNIDNSIYLGRGWKSFTNNYSIAPGHPSGCCEITPNCEAIGATISSA